MIIARLISLSILCGGCVGVATLPPPNATCGTLALGHKHTCVVSSMRGRVRCWGAGNFGELGYGSLQNIGSAPGTVPALVDDVPVLGDAAAVVQVSAGFGHTCALLDKGTVRCWGNGANGRLGYGDELPRNVPSDDDVAVSPTNRVVQIAAGGHHTCALLDNGRVRCWGLDDDGQLGYGKIDYPSQVRMVLLPASVGDVNVSTTHAVVQITTGMYHTCALLANGAVRCWGYGANGRLGYGSNESLGDRPSTVPAAVGDVRVSLTERVVQVSAGSDHTCAVLSDGAVRCWGLGSGGRLGYGNAANVGDMPSALPWMAGDVIFAALVVDVTAGGAHTCARFENGDVRCWGIGRFGRLGYGNEFNVGETGNLLPSSLSPVPVAGRVMQIRAGGLHTCVLYDNGGNACWGSGEFGQLGYGSTKSAGFSPFSIPILQGAVNVGWAVSIACTPLGSTAATATNSTPPAPGAPGASSPAQASPAARADGSPSVPLATVWIVVAAVAVAALCLVVCVAAALLALRRRRMHQRPPSSNRFDRTGVAAAAQAEAPSEGRSGSAGSLTSPFADGARPSRRSLYSTAELFHLGKRFATGGAPAASDAHRYEHQEKVRSRASSRAHGPGAALRSRSGSVATMTRGLSRNKGIAYESPAAALRPAGGYEAAQLRIAADGDGGGGGGGRYESASGMLRGATMRS